ncbi:MAG: hypothetical protein J5J00_11220 [Deltaproteobacteria bacterium]|nr:hypothetical protein [Deltaproteobacteria bacterium]
MRDPSDPYKIQQKLFAGIVLLGITAWMYYTGSDCDRPPHLWDHEECITRDDGLFFTGILLFLGGMGVTALYLAISTYFRVRKWDNEERLAEEDHRSDRNP